MVQLLYYTSLYATLVSIAYHERIILGHRTKCNMYDIGNKGYIFKSFGFNQTVILCLGVTKRIHFCRDILHDMPTLHTSVP